MKKTWKSINQCLNKNSKSNKIMHIKDANNKDVKSKDMANAFNEHFVNVGSNLAQQLSQSHHPPEYYIKRMDKIFSFKKSLKKK